MAELMHLYQTSDIVVYGTPIYLWSMTACLKNFLDRLIPLKSPTVQESQGRYDMKDQLIKNPKVIILANAGFPGEHNFDIFRMTVKPAEPILEIYRNCGMALQTKDPSLKNRIADYLSFVHQAGYQMASHEEVIDEVRTGLNMPLMSDNEYLQYISKGNKL